jgi:hypothetical protein
MLACLVGAVAATAPAGAAVITYATEAAFVAAHPGLVGFESFETPFGTHAGATTLAFPGFTVASTEPLYQFTNGIYTPPTHGVSVLGYNNDFFAAPTTVTLTFDSPVTAFGLNLLGVGDFTPGTFTVTTANGQLTQVLSSVPPQLPFPAPAIFFGLMSDTPFTTVTFTGTALGDRIGLDSVRFGMASTLPAANPAAVPEPISIAVFGGLLAVGGLVARRRVKVVA